METFLDLYERHVGETEVPKRYTRWACLALLAAFAEARIVGMKHAGAPVRTNLHVLLVGPGGIGRSTAIQTAMTLAEPLLPRLNVCWGRLTAQDLISSLGAKPRHATQRDDGIFTPPRHVVMESAPTWAVIDDMGLACTTKKTAEDFVNQMTALYGGAPCAFEDKSGVLGMVKIRIPALSWLGGADRDWIIRHVSPEAIYSGFFGQVVIVEAVLRPEVRVTEPSYPPDYDALVAELRWRLGRILAIRSATVPLAPDGREWMNHWYQTRPKPPDTKLSSVWRTQQDLLYKVAMVLALSEWTGRAREWADDVARAAPITVREWHLVEALGYVTEAQEPVSDYIHEALVTPPAILVRTIAKEIRAHGEVSRTVLQQKATRLGFNYAQLDRVVNHLVAEGYVSKRQRVGEKKRTHQRFYAWRNPAEEEPADDQRPGETRLLEPKPADQGNATGSASTGAEFSAAPRA